VHGGVGGLDVAVSGGEEKARAWMDSRFLGVVIARLCFGVSRDDYLGWRILKEDSALEVFGYIDLKRTV
jgi:hypothetical protein